MIKKTILTSALTLSTYASSCWTSVELSEISLAGFDRTAIFSVKDAVTCKPIKVKNYHISFRKTKNIADIVYLDIDAMKGYGPETITLDKLDKNDTYKVIVNRFSAKGTIDEKTKIRVYLNNKLDKIVRFKSTNAKCVQVASITNNKINYEFKELADSECR